MMLVSSCCRKSPLAEPGFDMAFQYAHKITAYLSQILYRWEISDVNTIFGDFGLDLWSRTNRTSWCWSMHILKELSRSNMLQDHIWNEHCSRSMFVMHLEQNAFQIRSWSIFTLEYSSRLSYGPGPLYKYWLLMREIVQTNSPRWLETVGYYISREEVEGNIGTRSPVNEGSYFAQFPD